MTRRETWDSLTSAERRVVVLFPVLVLLGGVVFALALSGHLLLMGAVALATLLVAHRFGIAATLARAEHTTGDDS